MKISSRRFAAWAALLFGLLAALHFMNGGIPRKNRLRIDLMADRTVAEVRVEVFDWRGDMLRSATVRPPVPNPKSVEFTLPLPSGDYSVAVDFQAGTSGELDKNHGGGWTRVGVMHQIRFEGEDHHFPPPDDEAK